MFFQSGETKNASVSGNLALGGSGNGLSIKGNADESIAAKAGLQAGEGDKNAVHKIVLLLGPLMCV